MLYEKVHLAISTMLRYRFILGAAAGIALAALVGVIALYPTSKAKDGPNLLMKDGFDFNTLRSSNKEWGGPDIGETVDMNRLKGHDGETLASIIGDRPAMLVVVDPRCSMCKVAADQMNYVRNQLLPMRVAYYVTDFSPVDRNFYQRYATGLVDGVPAFLWSQDEVTPPQSLLKIVQPSHILIDHSGTVLRVWPGSNATKTVRDRMGSQIVFDTGVIIDTLQALTLEPKPRAAEKKDSVSGR